MNAPENYRTEVLPYEEAPWAPRLTGYRFRWAWRVLNADGSMHIRGASNGSVTEAQESAKNAAHRRIANNHGVLIPQAVIIKKPRPSMVDDSDLKSNGVGITDDGDNLSV